MKNTTFKIKKILSTIIGKSIKDIDFKMTFKELGITSINLIHTIIKIEQEFGIEIDDNDLDILNYITFYDLESKIQNKYLL